MPTLVLSGTESNGHLINTGKGLVFRVQSDASASFQFSSNAPGTFSLYHFELFKIICKFIVYKGSKHHNHSPHLNYLSKHGSQMETSAHHSNNLLSNPNSEHGSSNSFHKQQTSNSLDSIDQLGSSIDLSGGPLAYTYTLSHLRFFS